MQWGFVHQFHDFVVKYSIIIQGDPYLLMLFEAISFSCTGGFKSMESQEVLKQYILLL